MIYFIICFVLFSCFVYLKLIKPHRYWSELGIKQLNPKILFGDNWKGALMRENIVDFIISVYKGFSGLRYGGIYQFYVPVLFIRDTELLKQIAIKDFDHFVDRKSFLPKESDPLWGKNLFALTGKPWRDMRATLSPSFTSSKMKNMFTLISESAENFVQYFERQNEDIITIEMKDTFTRFANDVIATTAFGIKVDSLENKNNEFYLMGREATNFTTVWVMIKFLTYFSFPKIFEIFNIPFFRRKVSSFFRNLIFETIETRETKGIIRNDMINLLIEAKNGNIKQEVTKKDVIETGFATVEESDIGNKQIKLTNEDIAAQAFVFFIAGFESVSGLMCFMSYELAVNQDVQDILRNEIEETLKYCNGKLNYEALMNMKYLDMVVSESLRKWPNVPAADRVCTKPYTIEPVNADEKPIHLKENAVIWIPIIAFHRDPEYYPDPDKFDPERFSDENKHNIKPYTYLPFGIGPRNCIGSRFAILETKLIFFNILSKFKIIPVEKSVIPIKLKNTMTLTAENGFWFGFKKL